jgi:hypothetical protein
MGLPHKFRVCMNYAKHRPRVGGKKSMDIRDWNKIKKIT